MIALLSIGDVIMAVGIATNVVAFLAGVWLGRRL